MLNAYGSKHKHICTKSQLFFALGFCYPFLVVRGLLTAVINQLSGLFFASVQYEIDLIMLEAKR